MSAVSTHKPPKRCAVYCRVSSDERLDQEFNSIDAQKEAGHAFIASQRTEGWIPVTDDYDDPGFSGGTMERPALKRLLTDIERGKLDIIVVYKIDQLSRSLADFARMVEIFDRHGVSFSAVTQQINSATSMGRLMLNVLLSFAQFEREVTGERIRDKFAASWRSLRLILPRSISSISQHPIRPETAGKALDAGNQNRIASRVLKPGGEHQASRQTLGRVRPVAHPIRTVGAGQRRKKQRWGCCAFPIAQADRPMLHFHNSAT